MIKVGQIYREKNLSEKQEDSTFVITRVGNTISIIYRDGGTINVEWEWLDEECILIAEYPRWQEAVNSKEFIGD